MKIDIDDVICEYSFRIMMAVLGKGGARAMYDIGPRMQESLLMSTLEGAVLCGAAEHEYFHDRNVDQFNSTDRLIRNWDFMFPGSECNASRESRNIVTLKGKRTRYFNDKWLNCDPDNPVPWWPR